MVSTIDMKPYLSFLTESLSWSISLTLFFISSSSCSKNYSYLAVLVSSHGSHSSCIWVSASCCCLSCISWSCACCWAITCSFNWKMKSCTCWLKPKGAPVCPGKNALFYNFDRAAWSPSKPPWVCWAMTKSIKMGYPVIESNFKLFCIDYRLWLCGFFLLLLLLGFFFDFFFGSAATVYNSAF